MYPYFSPNNRESEKNIKNVYPYFLNVYPYFSLSNRENQNKVEIQIRIQVLKKNTRKQYK